MCSLRGILLQKTGPDLLLAGIERVMGARKVPIGARNGMDVRELRTNAGKCKAEMNANKQMFRFEKYLRKMLDKSWLRW